MAITIHISKDLQKELIKRKMFDKESYEDVIWDLIEDRVKLSEKTKKELANARAEIKTGKIRTLTQVKRQLGQ